VTPFLYEIFETLPPGVGEVDKLNGEDELQRLEEQFLREIRPSLGPRKGIDITRNATEADFEKLNSLVKKTLESGDPHLNAMTGASVRLSLFVLPTSIIDHKKNNEANRDTGIISLERPSWPSKYLFVPQQNR
jgi:hypothetical protein